jgi:tetratricopeptide (TPR) repeat protein
MGRICANRIEQGESIQYQAEGQEALDYFRKAAKIQAVLELESDLASSLAWQGYLYNAQGRYSEAEPLYVRSLEIMERQLGADHPDVASSLNNLALLYKSQGRYSEAELLYVRSFQIAENKLGLAHPHTILVRQNLASLYDKMAEQFKLLGRQDKIVEVLEKAIALRSK